MKHYFKHWIYLSFIAFSFLAITSCQDDPKNYDNKVFIDNTSKVSTLLLKGNEETTEAVIQTAIAKPEKSMIKITYEADANLVEQYNTAYYDNAIALPKECYEIANPTTTITAGSVKADDVKVVFKELSTLSREKVYVLPVTIADADIAVLKSAGTTYFIVKGAALINTVANIKENKLNLKFSNAAVLNNLSQVTVEALIRVDKFGKLISTIMGIENNFLIRAGDAGIPDNQIQLATSRGNVTDANWSINTGEWTHVAVTFDSSDGAVNVYLNGVKKGATQFCSYRNKVNWGNNRFWIGFSYEDSRYLDGDICECRIWNKVLTADDINAKYHFYMVSPTEDGLIAYWKFDEGIGTVIKDHTVNGNDAAAASALTWKPVELPAK